MKDRFYSAVDVAEGKDTCVETTWYNGEIVKQVVVSSVSN